MRSHGFNLATVVSDPPIIGALRGAIDESPNLEIRSDYAGGMTHMQWMAVDGSIADLRVWVDIRHPNRGDLRVFLVTPRNKIILLHNGEAQGRHLIRQYTTKTKSGLRRLEGAAAFGYWGLKVMDLAETGAGVLKRWGMEIRCRNR